MRDPTLKRGLTLEPTEKLASIGVDDARTLQTHTIHRDGHAHVILVFGDIELRDRIVACVNVCAGISTAALDEILELSTTGERLVALAHDAKRLAKMRGEDRSDFEDEDPEDRTIPGDLEPGTEHLP